LNLLFGIAPECKIGLVVGAPFNHNRIAFFKITSFITDAVILLLGIRELASVIGKIEALPVYKAVFKS
jgi:hypothetical protein